jgi:hypothetical protein
MNRRETRGFPRNRNHVFPDETGDGTFLVVLGCVMISAAALWLYLAF